MDGAAGDLRIHLHFEPELLHLVFEGVLSNGGLVDELARVWGSSEYVYEIPELYDLRGITGSVLDASGVQLAADLDLDLFGDAPALRSAIVATDGLHFGLARMFQAYLDDRGANVQVFADFDEARAWLGA